MPRLHRRRALAVTALGVAVATAVSLAPTTAAGPAPAPQAPVAGEPRGFYDARDSLTAVGWSTPAAAQSSLGAAVLRDLDPATGTPRMVARLDGHLTGPSDRDPEDVVLGYVRAHLADLGLTEPDLASLSLRRTYVDVAGTSHLSWVQDVGGVEIFGHGLQAAVTASGRLLTLGGSPMPVELVAEAEGTALPTPEAAIRAARRDLGETVAPGPRDEAEEMLFVTASTTYRAWRVLALSATNPSLSVVDAGSGTVLYRRPLSSHASAAEPADPPSTGLAHRYYPGSAEGGQQRLVNFTRKGWLPATADRLDGNNAHAWSDVDDDDVAAPSEEVKPLTGRDWSHPLRPFTLPWASSFCTTTGPCTWDPFTAGSWRRNRKQAATQAFYFVNAFHDHLAKSPIGFTEAAGNFQATNSGGEGLAGDPVLTQTANGADAGDGLPDGDHIDHASMATPPDGHSPTLELHLQHQPGTTYPAGDPYSPTHTADAADTVYHEYAHGLSNRLVVDAHGSSTLGGVQAGAMGEGWSDFYALDHLVAAGLQPDLPGTADVRMSAYDGAGADLERTEPIDCAKASTQAVCDGGATDALGGYTYADYGDVVGIPEVHGDGEIWGQTLWDLRTELGPDVARSLITRGMELAPHDPSFLDMRNAILLADTAVHAGAHRAAIWEVFANRGMGFYAGTLGADDTAPARDNRVRPASLQRAEITGVVRDVDTGEPLAGVPVTLAWQGGPGPVNPTVLTGEDGAYRLGPVPTGQYRKLAVTAPGYDPLVKGVRVTTAGTTKDLFVRRDWSAASGDATVAAFSGPDHSPRCGPDAALDGSTVTGWSSSTGAGDTFVPRSITVRLPIAVDIDEVAVDPAATCGDGPSASTAGYRIETSPDGSTWTLAVEGTFLPEDRGRLNPLVPAAGADDVRHVRLTMLSNQTPDFAQTCPEAPYSGCSFTDVSEVAVYGSPG